MVLALIVLCFWIAAAMLAVINLVAIPRLRRAARREDGPLVSVVIPARDEEQAIERTLLAFLAQDHPNLEVILVDDESADRTGAIARELEARDPRVRVIDGAPPPPGWLGKPWAQHQGAEAARGSLLLFVDADITYAPGAVAAAVDELERSGAGLLAFLPKVEMHGFWERVLMPQLSVAAFAMLPSFLANLVRSPKLAIGGGTGILMRRPVYAEAGGHAALRNAVIDDVSLARLAARVAPFRLVLADDFVSVRLYHGLGEIVRGFTKNFYFVLGARVPVALAILAGNALLHLAPWGYAAAAGATWLAGGTPDPAHIAGLSALAFLHLTRLTVYIPLRYGISNALLAHLPMTAVWTWIALRSVWIVGFRRELVWRGRSYDARLGRFGA
ncbi:MAG TPA: glycosyltransferase [Thermoanaerobaculia bacterium]|nr:glycosyltransferase [Thermoanaerobaculia bacterium]